MAAADRPDRLEADRLRAAVSGTFIGREIIVLAETASTNDDVWRMAQEGSGPGLVVFAEHQTAARGQRGNVWESAAHCGLGFSFFLRPDIEPQDSVRLTTWVAETIAASIRSEFSLPATVKSPNDVYIGGRKVAGVLVEMRAQPRCAHVAIIGVGLNVNQRREDFSVALRGRATSLAILTGHSVDRNDLAIALLRNLDRTYAKLFNRRD